MKIVHWLKKEGTAFCVLVLYFFFYFGIFIIFKKLILAHYHISFYGFGGAVLGALIAAKAVLAIENTPLSKHLDSAAPCQKILYDAFVYTTLALIFLYVEKTLELYHKEGTLRLAFLTAGRDDDVYLFCATVGWGALSFFTYAVFAAISRHLGPGELLRMLFTPRVKAATPPASETGSPPRKS